MAKGVDLQTCLGGVQLLPVHGSASLLYIGHLSKQMTADECATASDAIRCCKKKQTLMASFTFFFLYVMIFSKLALSLDEVFDAFVLLESLTVSSATYR